MSKYVYGLAVVLIFAGFGSYSFGQVQELDCEVGSRTCYVEIDIFEGSDPSSTNCYSEESVISVAIYGTKLYNEAPVYDVTTGLYSFTDADGNPTLDFRVLEIADVNEQTFVLESESDIPNEVHEKDGSKVRHEVGDKLEFHTKLKDTTLLGECDRIRDVILKGELMDGTKIEGFGEINLVGGNNILEREDNINKPLDPGSGNCLLRKTPNCESETTVEDIKETFSN